jgi:DNA-binding IclR family transcriptional regulator
MPPNGGPTTGKRYRIRSVERASNLLRTFVEHDVDLSLAEIAKENHLDPSTALRMLAVLEAQRLVEHDSSSGKYRLGVTCLELGSRFLRDNDIRKRALGLMESLRNGFGDTVHLSLLDGNEIVYLEKLDGLYPIGLMSARVGGKAPTHCTGAGKVLLAFLPEPELHPLLPSELKRYTDFTVTDPIELGIAFRRIREIGYAVSCQEHEIGVEDLAVPIFNDKGVAAAMSVSGPVQRIDRYLLEGRLIDQLQQAGAEISQQLGGGNWRYPREADSRREELVAEFPQA